MERDDRSGGGLRGRGRDTAAIGFVSSFSVGGGVRGAARAAGGDPDGAGLERPYAGGAKYRGPGRGGRAGAGGSGLANSLAAVAVGSRDVCGGGAFRDRRGADCVDGAAAERLDSGEARGRIAVLLSDRTPVPLAWGLHKPLVLLPAQARDWPEERLRAVLMHEGEHVRRHDLAAQMLAQAACALYWFHPLAWWALREFRKERERACDDAVLARGAAAHEYAGHLVDVLREAAARRNGWADAPAMAEPSDFESRVKALLDARRNRNPLSRRAAAMVATAALACVLPVALVHAQSGRAALAGVVTDPSGARVPGCKVVAKYADGSHEEVAVADAAGEYSFASIPGGQYALEFLSKGFAVGKASVTLVSGAAARADMQLAIGQAIEHVAVTGPRTGPAPAPRTTGTPQRIRVGGNVTPSRLIRQTRPVFPDGAPEGSVVIRAVVSKDGSVLNPVVVNTVDSRLAKAAIDAVSQWVYQPTLLNGEPVEMLTTITVDFQLTQ